MRIITKAGDDAQKFDEGTRKHHKLLNQLGQEVSLDVEHSNYNHSVSFTIRHDLKEYSYAGKKYFFIVFISLKLVFL